MEVVVEQHVCQVLQRVIQAQMVLVLLEVMEMIHHTNILAEMVETVNNLVLQEL